MLVRPSAHVARLVAFAVALGFGSAPTMDARATPSLDGAMEFAKSTLTQLCNDPNRSRFASRIGPTGARACYARVEPGHLAIEVRYRAAEFSAEGNEATASGVLRHELDFDKGSYFYCSDPSRDGYTTLYLNCDRISSVSNRYCARIEWTTRNDAASENETRDRSRRSFANILRLNPDDCNTMKAAMNFIAERSRRSSAQDAETFFSK